MVGVNCFIYFPIFRQPRPDFFREEDEVEVRPCPVSLSKFSLPGSGTFDLSVGPF